MRCPASSSTSAPRRSAPMAGQALPTVPTARGCWSPASRWRLIADTTTGRRLRRSPARPQAAACVTAQWVVGAARVTVGGQPALLQDSPAALPGAEQIPAGPPTVDRRPDAGEGELMANDQIAFPYRSTAGGGRRRPTTSSTCAT